MKKKNQVREDFMQNAGIYGKEKIYNNIISNLGIYTFVVSLQWISRGIQRYNQREHRNFNHIG